MGKRASETHVVCARSHEFVTLRELFSLVALEQAKILVFLVLSAWGLGVNCVVVTEIRFPGLEMNETNRQVKRRQFTGLVWGVLLPVTGLLRMPLS